MCSDAPSCLLTGPLLLHTWLHFEQEVVGACASHQIQFCWGGEVVSLSACEYFIENNSSQGLLQWAPPLVLYVRRQLTCVREAEALVGPGGVAVELQPQTIRCAVNDVAQHDVAREVPQKAGRRVLSVVHLANQAQWTSRRKPNMRTRRSSWAPRRGGRGGRARDRERGHQQQRGSPAALVSFD